MLAVAILLLVPFAFIVAPDHVDLNNETGGAVQYSTDNLFRSGTVFNNHATSLTLASGNYRDIATGDLNNDGIIDVALAVETGVTIYYGIGNGALGSSASLSLATNDVRRVAVGDLDNDGRADVAVTYISASDGLPRVGIFYQKDAFAASSNLQIPTYDDPWGIVIGDFSNSGVNGLAVICRGDQANGDPATLMVLRSPFINLADRKNVDIEGVSSLKMLAAGYVNTDSRIDLVAADAYGSSIVVLTQPFNFSNAWSPATMDIGGQIADVQFMDYSGSGVKKDLVTVKSGEDSNQIEIRTTTGSIPVSASHQLTLNGASSLALGSISGASYPDLVVLSGSENTARVYRHQGSSLDANSYYQFPVNTGPVKSSAFSGGMYVLSSGGTGAPTIEYYGYVSSSVSNADGNRFMDGEQPKEACAGDVSFGIVAAVYDGQNAIYVSSVSGAYRVITTSSVPTSLYIGDLDGDNVGDLAIGFKSSNSVSIYKGSASFMSNNSPITISLSSSLSQPQSLTGGRIAAIGKDVLIVGCRGGIDVIYNPLSGSPTQEVIGTGYSGDRIDVGFGSLDPSGTGSSIAALNANTARIELYHLRASPTVGDSYDASYSAWLTTAGYTANSIAVGDLDGNGRDDLAASTASNQLKVFSNTGSGFSAGSQPTTSITITGPAAQVRSGDLNDDGKDDLAVRYSSLAKIGIWLSKDSGFTNSFDMVSGGTASGLCVADISGDGRMDMVASSATSETLSYWLQNDLAPDANVWYSAGTLDVGESVSFDASNSTDSASDVSSLSYLWNFGDGNSSSQRTIQHQYMSEGVFACYLTVTDRSGLTDRVDFQITVNKPMEARIWASKYSPLKGETIYLQDVSFVPNGVSSREWDLGNGQKPTDPDVSVSYSLPGYYNVTLNVTDTIGHRSSATVMISVVQNSNPIEGLIANGGGTSFFMDEEIFFELKSTGGGAPISGFKWDMEYNATLGFNATTGITINQTTWSYNTIGEHTICVRNQNVNPVVEEFLTIYIMNFRPVAVISASADTSNNYTFDAVGSWDTLTDNGTLQYRWNFGEINGWTPWSNETRITKNYTSDGRYTVILEVKDQHGLVNSTTYQAVVDNSPPTINLDDGILTSQAYRGEDLVIKVNVTDVSGNIEQVLLIYTTNNETKTLVMTKVSGTDTYVATIPAEDVNDDLSFYIEAVDGDGHHTVTTAMSVSLTDRPNDQWMIVLAVVLAALGVIFILYFRARMVVDDVFIIYQDGNLMAHQTRRLKPGMDDQVLSSMLVAIQDFVKDSFKDEASTGLNRMDFGEKKVLVERGEHIYLAVVLHGKREGRVPQRMKDTISKAEKNYLEVLQEWDGDLEKVRGIKDETDPLLKGSLKEMMASMPFARRESAGPVEMTVCQYCETSYPASEPKCPKCGTTPEPPVPGADGTGPAA